MHWAVRDREIGGWAGIAALAVVLISYPCAGLGSTAVADIRPGMMRKQVAERLGTDGWDDPDAAPGVAFSLNPNAPPTPAQVQRYREGLATFFVRKRTYTGLFFTLTVTYHLDCVTSASVRNPTWDPRTWPGALIGLFVVGAAGFGAAEGSRRWRR